jgi:phage shock protein C
MVWTNSGTRHRLWRDTDRGILAGVCAGIADYIGVEPIVVRLVAVLGLVFFFPPTIVVYVILALVLRPKPPTLYASADEEAFWRGVGTAPADAAFPQTQVCGPRGAARPNGRPSHLRRFRPAPQVPRPRPLTEEIRCQ